MARFILRVDDVGWDVAEDGAKIKDEGLQYFTKWREAAGLQSMPVYYGVIPAMVDTPELEWLRDNLTGYEELSVHGWSHVRGSVVDRDRMELALNKFQDYRHCRSYIPPFNHYGVETLSAWADAGVLGEPIFFGGFHEEHHCYGHNISKVAGVYHLPAFQPLYDHSEPLIRKLDGWMDIQAPLVVTLHATWGRQNLKGVHDVVELLRPHLRTLDDAIGFYRQATPDLHKYSAPHFLAYSYVLDQELEIGSNVLDFGSRYSHLPAMLALRGARVTAYDRDPKLWEYQIKIAAEFEMQMVRCSTDLENVPAPFDAITACWAIQHNTKEEMGGIAKQLASRLRPGGKLIIVSSFTPEGCFYQTNRPDPQWVLNWAGHEQYIINPAGMRLVDQRFFKYQPSTVIGNYCGEKEANAVCYTLMKGAV